MPESEKIDPVCPQHFAADATVASVDATVADADASAAATGRQWNRRSCDRLRRQSQTGCAGAQETPVEMKRGRRRRRKRTKRRKRTRM